MFLFDVSRLLYANKYNYKPYIDSRLPLWPFAYSRQLILFMKIPFLQHMNIELIAIH